MSEIEEQWDRAPDDPDPEADLGYECVAVDVVAAEQYGQLLVLPDDDELLREDAFIVAGKNDVVQLDDVL